MGIPVYGLGRSRTRKDRLLFEIYFLEPPELPEIAIEGTTAHWSYRGRILTIKWDGSSRVTTVGFRDAVVARFESWNRAAPIAGAHLCRDGPWRHSRARVREAAGDPAWPFPFVNHGLRPERGAWEWWVVFEGSVPDRGEPKDWLRRRGFDLSTSGSWLRAHHSEMDPRPAMFDELINGFDDCIEGVHERNPIHAVFFGGPPKSSGSDAWHLWTLAHFDADASWAKRPRFEPAPRLAPDELARRMADAQAAYDHAEDMGDPASALEGLLEISKNIPKSHVEEWRHLQALIDELAEPLGS